jgi:ribosomal protein S16
MKDLAIDLRNSRVGAITENVWRMVAQDDWERRQAKLSELQKIRREKRDAKKHDD